MAEQKAGVVFRGKRTRNVRGNGQCAFLSHLLREWATIDKPDSWLSDCSASLHMIPTEQNL